MAQKNPFVDLWACFWNRWTAAVEVKCHRKILASEAKNEKKLIKKRGGTKGEMVQRPFQRVSAVL